MKQEHPHAAFLRAIADGESPESFLVRAEDWHGSPDLWITATGWISGVATDPARFSVRRKPRTIKIGNTEVQAGITEAPALGTEIRIADPTTRGFEFVSRWDGGGVDICRLERGLIHLTQEPAEAMGRALAAITEHKDHG